MDISVYCDDGGLATCSSPSAASVTAGTQRSLFATATVVVQQGIMAASLGPDGPIDPDAQATITDFIDYTEYLPSDLERSLALIEQLDESYLDSSDSVHHLLQTYGQLPHAPDRRASAQDAQALRQKISYRLDLALRYREGSYGEACRLADAVDRHYNRLQSIKSKLSALPRPPSRDPTPQPASQSPHARRAATRDAGHGANPRIKLRLEKHRVSAHATRGPAAASRPKPTPIAIVPGEVLSMPLLISPPAASLFSDDNVSESSADDSPPSQALVNRRAPKPARIRLVNTAGQSGVRKDKVPKPVPLDLDHEDRAGIATGNSQMQLTPPPPSAECGSDHAPWMRLTDWEMARLRKRMKKNTDWAPSDTMIRRELWEAGRGPENYHKAKQSAIAKGKSLIDVDNVERRDKNQPLRPGEISFDVQSQLFNKGMSLNVQKKEKKAALQREQALQAKREAEQVARNLGTLGSSFKTLFERPNGTGSIAGGSEPYSPAYFQRLQDERAMSVTSGSGHRTSKKRARDATRPTDEARLHAQLFSEIVKNGRPAAQLANGRKRRAGSPDTPSSITATGKNALASSTASHAGAAGSSRKTRPPHVSLIVRDPGSDAVGTGPLTSTSGRPTSRSGMLRMAAGAELRGRRGSEPVIGVPASSITATATGGNATLASRRSKRPAPGIVTNTSDGGAAVSIGKRANAPRKKGSAKKAAEGMAAQTPTSARRIDDENLPPEEEIDPDEPRYCLCGDVSFGTMVLCENVDCEKEWFHLDCVGLSEPPTRRAKWWCPDCREKLRKK